MTEIDKQVVFFPPKELAITRVIDAWEANSDSNSDREDELTKASMPSWSTISRKGLG